MNIPSKEQRKTLTRSEVSPFFSLILHKGGSAKKDFARSKTKNSSARKKFWRPPPHRKLGKKKLGHSLPLQLSVPWDIHDRSHRQLPFRFTAAPLRVADLPLLFPLALQPAATPAGARLQLPCILSWLDSTAASRPLPLPVELSLPFPLR